jgi:Domain of unknown function (DUF1707)
MSTETEPSGPATEPSGPATGQPSPMRASNAEREDTVARLHQALGEGRLDLAETEERVAATYAAQYRSELAPLLADLPHTEAAPWPRSGAPGWHELWTSAVWRARTGCSVRPAQSRPPRRRPEPPPS